MTKELEYWFYDDKESYNKDEETARNIISRILVPSTPSGSCWWSKLKSSQFFKNHKDFVAHKQVRMLKGEDVSSMYDNSTVKTCPAIIDILRNSFLLKSPCDMVITVDRKKNFVYEGANDLMRVGSHDTNQFYTEEGNLFEGKMNLKFQMPVRIRTNKVPFMFLQPMYHNNIWFSVFNGVGSGVYTQGMELNLNVSIDIPKTDEPVTYNIKNGDVLAYIWSPEKLKLSHAKRNFFDTLIPPSWKLKNSYFKFN